MAHCSVLEAHQKLTDRPSKRIKRSGGHSLVRRGLAVWIEMHILLQMRSTEALKSTPITLQNNRLQNAYYIPDRLPSHKTPGTKAIGPVVERSRTGVFRIMQANHLSRIQASQ